MLMSTQGLTELRKAYGKICMDVMLREEWQGARCLIRSAALGLEGLIGWELLMEPEDSFPHEAALESRSSQR